MPPATLRRTAAFAVGAVLLLTGCGRQQDAPTATPTVPAPATTSPPHPSPALPSPSGPPDEPGLQKAGDFNQPVHVTAPVDDPRLFVVEKTGRVKVLSGGSEKTFLDLSGKVALGYEQGLLSLAFDPGYRTSGRAYVNYTDERGDTRIVEYRVSSDPDRLDPATRREILSVDQPFQNHNGGLLLFDPSGKMLIGMGDGGSAGDPADRAQDLGQLLGKLLRIEPARPSGGRPYSIPPDNPFAGREEARGEIWAYGLRNPWRFSFDRQGNFYLGDVGQNQADEINVVAPAAQKGANYGWPAFEGSRRFKNRRIDESRLVRPALDHALRGGNCSVVGGGVYRGSVNSLKGLYLYADHCEGTVKSFRAEGSRAAGLKDTALEVSQPSSFGEDAAGEMYVASLDGAVFKIVKK